MRLPTLSATHHRLLVLVGAALVLASTLVPQYLPNFGVPEETATAIGGLIAAAATLWRIYFPSV